jgi:rSAM/selenodomain-associated transferase 1
MDRNILIIIAKHPDKDKVKTRLKGSMTDEKRVEFYRGLLKDTILRLGKISGVDTCIAYAPHNAEDYFMKFSLDTIPLPPGDLGFRMLHAFTEVFKAGYTKALLVGVDIPGLTESIILEAFKCLSDKDIVFGPALDGGYYLVGMKGLKKEIFFDVPWSSAITLKKSLVRAEQLGYSVGMTEMLSDIDTIDDAKTAGLLPDDCYPELDNPG